MINILISFFVMVISCNFFYVSYQVCGVNMIVLSMPKALFENAIDLVSTQDEPHLYFQKITLISTSSTYFRQLKKYTNNYRIDFKFYNDEDDSICTSDYCYAVNIIVDASLTFNYTIHRELYYKIQRN